MSTLTKIKKRRDLHNSLLTYMEDTDAVGLTECYKFIELLNQDIIDLKEEGNASNEVKFLQAAIRYVKSTTKHKRGSMSLFTLKEYISTAIEDIGGVPKTLNERDAILPERTPVKTYTTNYGSGSYNASAVTQVGTATGYRLYLQEGITKKGKSGVSYLVVGSKYPRNVAIGEVLSCDLHGKIHFCPLRFIKQFIQGGNKLSFSIMQSDLHLWRGGVWMDEGIDIVTLTYVGKKLVLPKKLQITS